MPAKKPQTQRKQTITVSLSPTMIKALDAMVKRNAPTSRSAIIEAALQRDLKVGEYRAA